MRDILLANVDAWSMQPGMQWNRLINLSLDDGNTYFIVTKVRRQQIFMVRIAVPARVKCVSEIFADVSLLSMRWMCSALHLNLWNMVVWLWWRLVSPKCIFRQRGNRAAIVEHFVPNNVLKSRIASVPSKIYTQTRQKVARRLSPTKCERETPFTNNN